MRALGEPSTEIDTGAFCHPSSADTVPCPNGGRHTDLPQAMPLPPAPPTVRDVTGWIARYPDSLTDDDRPRLKTVLERCPELQAASEGVRAFAVMMARLSLLRPHDPFPCAGDSEAREFCLSIASEIVLAARISLQEARERINQHWSRPAPGKSAPRIWIAGQDLTYHEDAAYWARVILEQTG